MAVIVGGCISVAQLLHTNQFMQVYVQLPGVAEYVHAWLGVVGIQLESVQILEKLGFVLHLGMHVFPLCAYPELQLDNAQLHQEDPHHVWVHAQLTIVHALVSDMQEVQEFSVWYHVMHLYRQLLVEAVVL